MFREVYELIKKTYKILNNGLTFFANISYNTNR